MNTHWKLMSIAGLCLIAILTIALAFSPRSQAQSASPASARYAYKVERLGRNAKDMDRILDEDGKAGWRILYVEAAGPDRNDFVFVMEKPAPAN